MLSRMWLRQQPRSRPPASSLSHSGRRPQRFGLARPSPLLLPLRQRRIVLVVACTGSALGSHKDTDDNGQPPPRPPKLEEVELPTQEKSESAAAATTTTTSSSTSSSPQKTITKKKVVKKKKPVPTRQEYTDTNVAQLDRLLREYKRNRNNRTTGTAVAELVANIATELTNENLTERDNLKNMANELATFLRRNAKEVPSSNWAACAQAMARTFPRERASRTCLITRRMFKGIRRYSDVPHLRAYVSDVGERHAAVIMAYAEAGDLVGSTGYYMLLRRRDDRRRGSSVESMNVMLPDPACTLEVCTSYMLAMSTCQRPRQASAAFDVASAITAHKSEDLLLRRWHQLPRRSKAQALRSMPKDLGGVGAVDVDAVWDALGIGTSSYDAALDATSRYRAYFFDCKAIHTRFERAIDAGGSDAKKLCRKAYHFRGSACYVLACCRTGRPSSGHVALRSMIARAFDSGWKLPQRHRDSTIRRKESKLLSYAVVVALHVEILRACSAKPLIEFRGDHRRAVMLFERTWDDLAKHVSATADKNASARQAQRSRDAPALPIDAYVARIDFYGRRLRNLPLALRTVVDLVPSASATLLRDIDVPPTTPDRRKMERMPAPNDRVFAAIYRAIAAEASGTKAHDNAAREQLRTLRDRLRAVQSAVANVPPSVHTLDALVACARELDVGIRSGDASTAWRAFDREWSIVSASITGSLPSSTCLALASVAARAGDSYHADLVWMDAARAHGARNSKAEDSSQGALNIVRFDKDMKTMAFYTQMLIAYGRDERGEDVRTLYRDVFDVFRDANVRFLLDALNEQGVGVMCESRDDAASVRTDTFDDAVHEDGVDRRVWSNAYASYHDLDSKDGNIDDASGGGDSGSFRYDSFDDDDEIDVDVDASYDSDSWSERSRNFYEMEMEDDGSEFKKPEPPRRPRTPRFASAPRRQLAIVSIALLHAYADALASTTGAYGEAAAVHAAVLYAVGSTRASEDSTTIAPRLSSGAHRGFGVRTLPRDTYESRWQRFAARWARYYLFEDGDVETGERRNASATLNLERLPLPMCGDVVLIALKLLREHYQAMEHDGAGEVTSLSISCRASSAATRVEAILSSLGVASTVRVLRFESSKTHLVEVLESHVMSWARRGPRASQQPR